MEMICKSCGHLSCSKNGKARGQQRYKCKNCGLNFIRGDKREKVSAEGKALAVLLYGRGKSSYGFIARLFNVTRPAVMKWIKNVAGRLPEPPIDESITAVQFDEMRHFVTQKKKSYGSGGHWTAVEIIPTVGVSAIALLKHSEPSSISSKD